MIACGAGPVVGRTLKLTNAPWVMDGPETARRAGLAQGLLLNDFEAQALSLPAIAEDWTRRIGPLPFGGAGPQVILGPGTGLGIAALVEADGRFTPGLVGSLPHRLRAGVAGGIRALAASRAGARAGDQRKRHLRRGARARPSGADDGARPSRSAVSSRRRSTAAALADPKGEAAASLRLYWRIVARFAGDMAVTFVATGGVTLAGGVLPRVVDFLDEAAFRAAFEAKAPVDALARRIPTRLIIRSDAVLVGMAAIAAAPDRYAIDYASRGWV